MSLFGILLLKSRCEIVIYLRDDEQYRGIPGYDFVVNSAWPQIVATLEKDLPELFSSRDPNFFHKVQYILTVGFSF